MVLIINLIKFLFFIFFCLKFRLAYRHIQNDEWVVVNFIELDCWLLRNHSLLYVIFLNEDFWNVNMQPKQYSIVQDVVKALYDISAR